MLFNFKVTIYLSIYLNKLSNKQKWDFYTKHNQYILGRKHDTKYAVTKINKYIKSKTWTAAFN